MPHFCKEHQLENTDVYFDTGYLLMMKLDGQTAGG